ncbi:MAG: nucleotide pyrophosphohydrolase [Candidatus Cloacimonetes bacterium]|nr:nucleotide pyrophosphohydrolase [Candidatus Cloacimonadota bacterium]MCF7815101.1 nucleotide pyrophosphohydrolase [Candidatus Cloacimonadota bacterium]MCF7868054.1 nucleotide pyrophosphohydrolase [Candidatus Cloacimonadota bacterium]MCF7883974.1 nucleotide pyrophosphohydrolase [Candidatus Cloacimonadota bacterium]
MNDLMLQIRKFIQERDWEQFHSPKNLAMALSIEAAEIMEHFQWKTAEESRQLNDDTLNEVKDEIGDTLVYLLRLCDELKIDPIKAAEDKMIKNAVKYPVDKAKGNAKKYTKFL